MRCTAMASFGEGELSHATVRGYPQANRKHVRPAVSTFPTAPTGIRKLNDVHRNHPEWHLVRAHIGEKRDSNIPLCRSEEAANGIGKEVAIRTT